jgi:hypothetical protein
MPPTPAGAAATPDFASRKIRCAHRAPMPDANSQVAAIWQRGRAVPPSFVGFALRNFSECSEYQ